MPTVEPPTGGLTGPQKEPPADTVERDPGRVMLISTAVLVFVAVALAVGAFLVHQNASDLQANANRNLHHAEAALARERSRNTDATAQLTKAQAAVRSLQPQMDAVTVAADAVAPLDDQSLAAVKAAVAAGLAGDVASYNAAVEQLNAANPGHDAALEHLRAQVNALVIALDPLRG